MAANQALALGVSIPLRQRVSNNYVRGSVISFSSDYLDFSSPDGGDTRVSYRPVGRYLHIPFPEPENSKSLRTSLHQDIISHCLRLLNSFGLSTVTTSILLSLFFADVFSLFFSFLSYISLRSRPYELEHIRSTFVVTGIEYAARQLLAT